MFTALIGPIANLAGTWFENKLAKTKADGEAKVAEAKARATVSSSVSSCYISVHPRNERVCAEWF